MHCCAIAGAPSRAIRWWRGGARSTVAGRAPNRGEIVFRGRPGPLMGHATLSRLQHDELRRRSLRSRLSPSASCGAPTDRRVRCGCRKTRRPAAADGTRSRSGADHRCGRCHPQLARHRRLDRGKLARPCICAAGRPGWALVCDPGDHKDTIAPFANSDAFREAEALTAGPSRGPPPGARLRRGASLYPARSQGCSPDAGKVLKTAYLAAAPASKRPLQGITCCRNRPLK
jgi:hypothetical protein